MAKVRRLFVLWRGEDGSLYAFDDLGKIDLSKDRDKLKHDAYLADGSKGKAVCRVRVSKRYTTLDYEPFAAANKKEGMLIGVARLERGANGILRVSWKPQGGKADIDAGVVISKAELKTLCDAADC